MSQRITKALIAALFVLGVAAPSALGAGPARVSVRVEAPTRTLVPLTTLTTTTKAVVKDGVAAHGCTGTSAAGALEQATKGSWTAAYFSGLGYSVSTIDGVAPASFSDYWTLWINGKSSQLGLCGSELARGDSVLLFLCHSGADFSCQNHPLAIRAPRSYRAGHPFTVHVDAIKDDGSTIPAAGATVRGGNAPATVAADGTARVTVGAGEAVLSASGIGDVVSDPVHCGGGSCGSSDRTAPRIAIARIKRGATFTAAHAPRELRGTALDASGVTVSLRLVRIANGSCSAFDGRSARFRRQAHCSVAKASFFDVGDKARWSYLLPAKLAAGRYVLDVRAVDGAGNARTSELRFKVTA
jgi:hypothetical protein